MQDKDTKAAMDEKKRSAEFVEKAEWQWAKGKLLNMMIALDSIDALRKEGRTPEEIGLECLINNKASRLVTEWITQLEGDAEEYTQFLNRNQDKESYIVRED